MLALTPGVSGESKESFRGRHVAVSALNLY